MDLFVSEVSKANHLSNNLACAAALLPTSRVRNDTKGTKLITSLNDRHKGHERRMSFDRGNLPRFAVSTLTQINDSPFPALEPFNHRSNPISRARSDDHVYCR